MTGSKSVVSKVAGIAVLLAIAPWATGCGVVFGGKRQRIQISSSPDGALVQTAPTTNDSRTPASIELERKTPYELTFSMPGYTSQKVQLRRSMRGGIVVLDIVLCCITVIVDAITGGWYKLDPQQVSATLTKTAADTAGPEQITVTVNVRPTKKGATVQIESTVPGVSVDAVGH